LERGSYCTFDSGCSADMVTPAVPYDCGPTLHGDMMNNTGTPFNSSTGIAQSPSSTGFFLQLFGKDDFDDPVGMYGYNNFTTGNPFYLATGASLATTEALANDPEAVQVSGVDQLNSGFILQCTSTVYEVTYITVNGSVVNGTYKVANDTLPSNLRWTLTYVQAYSQNALEAAWISGAQQSNTSEELADFFAQRFSETALSMVVGITEPAPTLAERSREHLLVTRLPKAPFFTLIVLNLLYAALGVLLAGLAIASQPRRTRDVQARLSIAGLVAALFELHPGAAVAQSKRTAPSGIEGVFAEYYQRGDQDGARVVVVPAGEGSHAFEKTSPESVTVRSHWSNKSAGASQNASEESPVPMPTTHPEVSQTDTSAATAAATCTRTRADGPVGHDMRQSGRSSTY